VKHDKCADSARGTRRAITASLLFGGAVADAVGFSPLPLDPLPFPSIVVASEDDKNLSLRRARQLAAASGSTLVNIGRNGHINSASGIGQWEEARAIRLHFLERLILPPLRTT
jgi:predicted alpha/beta hydrolase family esterase